MADSPQLIAASKELQAKLANAQLTPMQKILSGIDRLPESFEANTHIIGGQPSSIQAQVMEASGNAATVNLSGASQTILSVTFNGRTHDWNILSTQEDKERFKEAVKGLAASSPTFAGVLNGSQYPDSLERFVAPTDKAVSTEKSR